MTVVIVKPGYAPYEADINGLDEMQKVVGGIIQAIYPFEDNPQSFVMTRDCSWTCPSTAVCLADMAVCSGTFSSAA